MNRKLLSSFFWIAVGLTGFTTVAVDAAFLIALESPRTERSTSSVNALQ